MTRDAAIKQARKRAKQAQEERYVVYSPEPQDTPGHFFHVARVEELYTFYNGATIEYCTADGDE